MWTYSLNTPKISTLYFRLLFREKISEKKKSVSWFWANIHYPVLTHCHYFWILASVYINNDMHDSYVRFTACGAYDRNDIYCYCQGHVSKSLHYKCMTCCHYCCWVTQHLNTWEEALGGFSKVCKKTGKKEEQRLEYNSMWAGKGFMLLCQQISVKVEDILPF